MTSQREARRLSLLSQHSVKKVFIFSSCRPDYIMVICHGVWATFRKPGYKSQITALSWCFRNCVAFRQHQSVLCFLQVAAGPADSSINLPITDHRCAESSQDVFGVRAKWMRMRNEHMDKHKIQSLLSIQRVEGGAIKRINRGRGLRCIWFNSGALFQ